MMTLTEEQWTKIYTFLCQCAGVYVKNETKTRRFVEAILWLVRTGAQWRELPRNMASGTVLRSDLGAGAKPARKNRTETRHIDWHLYKERHLVECFINKIKWYRRIFSRFDKLAKHFWGFLSFVASLIWLR